MLLLVLAVFVVLFQVVLCLKFPSYIEKCQKTDTNMKTCLNRALQDVQPHLLKGIPEFQLPRMDPLRIPEVGFIAEGSFKAKFKDVEIYEADKFIINNFGMDLEKNQINFNLKFPFIRIKGHYYIVGKVMFFTLNGNGPAEGNITDVTVVATLTGNRYSKKGKEYIKLSEYTIDCIEIHKPKFDFYNLFKKNMVLTQQINKILNENMEVIIEELKPTLEPTIGTTIMDFVGRVFNRFSLDELFLS